MKKRSSALALAARRRRSLAGGFGVARRAQPRTRNAAGVDFSARVDNPWFPLKPGTRYVYTGVKDGKPSRDVVTVTHRTKTIDGRPLRRRRATGSTCAAGSASARPTGTARTRAATSGTSARTPPSSTSTATSRAPKAPGRRASTAPGRHLHARPPARRPVGPAGVLQGPRRGPLQGDRALQRRQPLRGTKNALLTQETTPLEPGTIDHKMYVRGIGTVLEQTEKGGDERNELVSVTSGT